MSTTYGRKVKQLVADPEIQRQLRIVPLLQSSKHMEEPEKRCEDYTRDSSKAARSCCYELRV
jgi:hypothetical protein